MICGDAQHPINLRIKHHMSHPTCRIQATPGCRGSASRRFSSFRLFTELSGSRTWQRPVEISRNATGKDLDTLSIKQQGKELLKSVWTTPICQNHSKAFFLASLHSVGLQKIISRRSALYLPTGVVNRLWQHLLQQLPYQSCRWDEALLPVPEGSQPLAMWRIQALVPTSQWIWTTSKIGILWLLEVLNVYISKCIFCNYPTKL